MLGKRHFLTKRLVQGLVSLLLIAGLVAVSLLFLSKSIKADSLIGFNEGSGTSLHVATGGITGTITNAVWRPESECLTGSCLYFDGTGDYVSFGDEATYDFAAATNWSIELWFKTGSITTGTRTLLSKYDSATSTDGGYKIYMSSDGKLNFGIDDDQTSFPEDLATSQSRYDDNQWHFLSATKTGTTGITLYIDAQKVAQDPSLSSTGTLVNTDSFFLGSDNGSSNGWLGYLDELKITVASARTADQIKTDFQKTTSDHGVSVRLGPDTSVLNNGLVGYWKMDESSGNPTDYSGNGYTLTNNGTTTFVSGKYGKGSEYVPASNQYFSVSATKTYYFDASDAVASDPGGVWSDDNYAFNGDTSTFSSTSSFGDQNTNYLMAEGTSAPATGGSISQVRARIFAGVDDNQGSGMQAKIYSDGLLEELTTITNFEFPAAWGGYFTLTTPTGGWTWPKIQSLEIKAFVSNVGQTLNAANVYKIELEVTTPADTIPGLKSVSFWVNPDNTSNYYLSLTSGAYITSSSGIVSTAGLNNSKIYINGIPSNIVIADSWQHVVVTFDSIDADQFYIGKQGSNYFDGTMDEVRLYSRILSDSDVTKLYNWAPDPIAYFPFDENTNTITINDLSGNNNYSSTSGLSGSSWVPGKIGSAIKFLGTSNQSIVAADSPSLSLTGDFTISAWINPNTITANTRYPLVSKNTNLTTKSYEMSLYGDEIRVYIGSISNYVTTNTTNLVVGNWYYISAIYSSLAQTVTIYVNGIPQVSTTTGTIPASISDLSNSFNLGTTTGSAGTLNYQVGASADDANMTSISNDSDRNVTASGTVSITNTLFPPGSHGNNNEYTAGARFTSVALPRYSTITSATFTITPAATKNVSPNFVRYHVSGQATDNPGVFTTTAGDLNTTARPRTTTDCGGWNQNSVTINVNQLTEVKNCIQELANRPGWNSGNAIVILIDTDTTTTLSQFQDYFTYDNTPSKAPKLDITYTSIDPYDGLMDDVKIYNYTRTQKQIISDMNGGHPAPGSPVGSATAFWKFDEGYGTTANDSGTSKSNLTLSSASWTNSGKFGKAFLGGNNLRVTGTDNVNLEPAASEDFSITSWFKSTGATTAATEYLVSKGGSGAGGYQLYFNTSGQLVCGIDDDAASFPADSVTSPADVYDTTWHQAICVRDITNNKLTLYIDGLPVASDPSISATGTMGTTSVFYLGDQNGTDGTDEFLGSIDETKFYRLALTPDQVKLEYNQGKTEVLGALSTSSTGLADNSSDRSYCVPGDSATCTSPVGDWKLDENTGQAAHDDSGNGNELQFGDSTGVDTYDPTWTANGHTGSAVSFKDNHEALSSTGDLPTLNMDTGNFTLEAWIYRNATGSDDIIINKKVSGYGSTCSDSFTVGYQFIQTSANELVIALCDQTNGYALTSAADVASPGTWHHVAAVIDRSVAANRKIYVDGVSVTTTPSGTMPANSISNPYMFDIGSQVGLYYYYNGKIDNVLIYNYARTPSQITWDYNRGKPVAWYKFDEASWNNNCSTPTVFDSSGKALHGLSCPNTTGQTTPEAGKINSAMHYDDVNDYVSVADNNNLDLTGGLSVSAWVNTDANEADNVILSKGTSYEVGINADGDVYWDGVGAQVDDASTKVQSGVWHHVVVTDDDTTVTFYVDGVKTGSTASGVDTDNATAMYIGYDGTNYFDGLLDDVKVFSYPLNSTQVKTLYNSGAVKF